MAVGRNSQTFSGVTRTPKSLERDCYYYAIGKADQPPAFLSLAWQFDRYVGKMTYTEFLEADARLLSGMSVALNAYDAVTAIGRADDVVAFQNENPEAAETYLDLRKRYG